ncbi:hypothetical protein Q8F55_005553 [Vanrija albida]|uniref:Secreted protein n=1 Tax=Vanrija albida TaxID=181172 RepID=A0ABR3Q264_9TREE
MHPSHTLVPRVVNLLARVRVLPAAAARPTAILGAPKLLVEHAETHSPTPAPSRRMPVREAFFSEPPNRPRRGRLPAPMIAWNDHLRMV